LGAAEGGRLGGGGGEGLWVGKIAKEKGKTRELTLGWKDS